MKILIPIFLCQKTTHSQKSFPVVPDQAVA